ncbi:MAG: 2OG-Fe(II) oxygenase [Magnetovibrio sp.]|nr:2OG-Fe(II) oxygenase [Magnetovibrio sp.]
MGFGKLTPEMRLEHPFCIVDQAFAPALCERVVELGQSIEPMAAEVARDPTNSVRDSTVAWIAQSPDTAAWLYDAVDQLVQATNARLWKWRLSTVESMQFTVYGRDQYYEWHADQRKRPYPDDDPRWPGLVRKLSVTINLTAGESYDGGDFMVETLNATPDDTDRRLRTLTEARGLGAAIIFPSHLFHRVTPVTAGTRRSLVGWFLGPPFA